MSSATLGVRKLVPAKGFEPLTPSLRIPATGLAQADDYAGHVPRETLPYPVGFTAWNAPLYGGSGLDWATGLEVEGAL